MRLAVAALMGLAVAAVVGVLVGQPLIPRLPGLGRWRAWAARRRHWLRQAGAPLTLAEYYAVNSAAAVAVFGLVLTVVDAWAVAVVPAAAGGLALPLYYARRRRHRKGRLARACPDALRELAATFRGDPTTTVGQAVAGLADRGPPAIREALAGWDSRATALGTTEALEHYRHQLADPTTDRIIEVLLLGEEDRRGITGMLADLAEALDQDLRLKQQIATLHRRPLLEAVWAAPIPWVAMLVVAAQFPAVRDFYRTPAGLLAVAVAAAFTAAGVGGVWLLTRPPAGRRPLGRQEEG